MEGIQVSILIAVYNPNLEWLKQQLQSIEHQTFRNYEVIVMDDGSDRVSFLEIQKAVRTSIRKHKKVSIYQSLRNEGSDRTFEKLTLLAQGDYIAFCDQDDVWEKEKLAQLIAAAKRENAVMAYSDMSVIDENGVQIYSSLRKMRKGLEYVHGRNVTAKYLAVNCTAGCSMLVRADLLKKAVPFSRQTYCDQWIAACVSAYGKVAFVNRPLVRYRRHGGNQTGSLERIWDRKNYDRERILPMCALVEEMKDRKIHFFQEEEVMAFAKARKNKDIRQIWKYRKFCRKYAYFDLVMICMPEIIVNLLLKVLQNGGSIRAADICSRQGNVWNRK